MTVYKDIQCWEIHHRRMFSKSFLECIKNTSLFVCLCLCDMSIFIMCLLSALTVPSGTTWKEKKICISRMTAPLTMYFSCSVVDSWSPLLIISQWPRCKVIALRFAVYCALMSNNWYVSARLSAALLSSYSVLRGAFQLWHIKDSVRALIFSF